MPYPTDAVLGQTLTGRELEVLQLMSEGLSNRQIGAKLELSVNTVKGYVARTLAKLGAVNRAQAVRKAIEQHVLGTAAPSA
jgi:DNA-binding NarL/FixJ family response regulator